MKKFEVGGYVKYYGESEIYYWIEKVTAKMILVTIHKGSKYEQTKRFKVVDCGAIQHCHAFGMLLSSDDDEIEIA